MESIAECHQYLEIAKGLDIFHESEIQILEGVLIDYEQAKDGYVLLHEKKDDRVVGFVIFGKIPITFSSWDIYWLVVDKNYQGKGIGKKLLKDVEAYILEKAGCANLRVETSTRKEYAHARNLYLKVGFEEVGRIKDFYDQGDDVAIFYKKISSQN